MWRVPFICLPFILAQISSFSQTRIADSLSRALQKHPEQDTMRVKVLNDLAFEEHFSHPAQSLDFSTQARQLSIALNYKLGVALSYRYTGLALWTQAMYADALDSFYKGLHLADSLGIKTVKADITGNIGLVQNGMGNYAEALKSFQTSYSIHQELKNTRRMVVMMNNIGDCYLYLNQPSEALTAYTESLNLGKPISFLEETNNRNIGNVYESQGDYKNAEKFYQESKRIGDLLNEKREMTLIRKSMASLYLKQGNTLLAEKWAKESAEIAKAGNYRAPLRDVYFLLSRIMDKQKNYSESLDYYKLATAYKDSIQNLTEASRVAALQRTYELQLKQKQIDNLKKDAALKEQELTRNRLLLISSAVGVILLSLYGYTIIRSYRFQKAVTVLLKDRNAEISNQNKKLHDQQIELKNLHDAMVLQAEEVTAQRDLLSEKNQEIEKLNIELSSLNYHLEKKVEDRTKTLEIQNKALADYSFFNAHKLRAPVARIMGIINILEIKHITNDNDQLLEFLRTSSKELDDITRSMGAQLDSGVSAFEQNENE